MSNSSLVNVKIMTKHYGYPDGKAGRGGAKIDKIFVHHMAGILTAEQCGNVFKNREASAHYGIDTKGRIGLYVDEANAAWHCGSKAYNQRSIGIELSNDGGAKTGWHVADKTIAKCIDLIVDICKRNGIKKINYTGDLKGNLCMHRWVASTACPASYLGSKFKYIAEQVNKKLGAAPAKEVLYRVRKTWADAKSQVGAYKNLANAKKVADEKHLNVYDDKGKLVYEGKKKDSKTYIGQACADYDGKAGDSSGKEVCKSAFKYSTSSTNCYNWTYVFRPKDEKKAEKAAAMCEKGIANNAIGYCKNGETAYGKDKAMTKLAKAVNYDLSKITSKCGCSCGDFVCLCNHYAGLSTCYIGSGLGLSKNLKSNSNFECINYKKGVTLKRGDTIITAHANGKDNHVAMVL